MVRYRVTIQVGAPVAVRQAGQPAAVSARRVVCAPCARAAACDIAGPYVEAGLTVDWSARRTGLCRLGRRWTGRFIPGDGDGLGGVREPRRPAPSSGSTWAAVDPPAA